MKMELEGLLEGVIRGILILILLGVLGFLAGVMIGKREIYVECMNIAKEQGLSEQRANERCSYEEEKGE